MSFEFLRKRKAAEILVMLLKGAKGVRELQEAVGGSNSTIKDRIKELLANGFIEDVRLTGEEYGEIPHNKRLLRLTDKGHEVANSLVEAGFLRLPLFHKIRDEWIVAVLGSLKRIKGRTRFMKLLFLLKYKFGLEKAGYFKFKPWIFGPFSKEVARDLEELRGEAIIHEDLVYFKQNEHREEDKSFEYTLTAKGEKMAFELLSNLPRDDFQKLEKLKLFNEMPLLNLLEYVYRMYPDFITRSEIVRKVLGT